MDTCRHCGRPVCRGRYLAWTHANGQARSARPHYASPVRPTLAARSAAHPQGFPPVLPVERPSSTRDASDFWSLVDQGDPDACWPWRGPLGSHGYGRYREQGAHRWALRVSGVDIPKGLWVLHSCDNPPCCNPRHLRVGTARDNALDMHSRGRQPAHLRPRPTCNQGHPISGDNLVMWGDRRRCRICTSALNAERRLDGRRPRSRQPVSAGADSSPG